MFKLKRLISAFLASFVLLTAVQLPALADGIVLPTIYYSGDFAYMSGDFSTCTIVAYRGSETSLTIPESLDSKTVTGVHNLSSDDGMSSLISITIPSTVLTVNASSMYKLNNLKEIRVDSGNPNYSSIDGILFSHDNSTLLYYPRARTESEISIPNGTVRIENEAFSDNFTLKKVTFPEGLLSIGDNAFIGCSSLETVIFPSTITTIGNYAFSSTALKSVQLPSALVSLGAGCLAYSGTGSYDSQFIIYAPEGSAAHSFAVANHIKYFSGLPGTVTGISISQTKCTTGLNCTGGFWLTAAVSPADAPDAKFEWTSDNEDIAVIAFWGQISLMGQTGTVTLTATSSDGGFKAGCVLTVLEYYEPQKGDINQDESVDTIDALNMLKFTVGKLNLSDFSKGVADVNKDSKVDSADSLTLLQSIVGKVEL